MTEKTRKHPCRIYKKVNLLAFELLSQTEDRQTGTNNETNTQRIDNKGKGSSQEVNRRWDGNG